MIAALSGLLSKDGLMALGALLLAALLVGGCWWAVDQHTARVVAEAQVGQLTADNATITAQSIAYEASIGSVSKAIADRSALTQTITRNIANAPASNACAGSPAVSAAIAGLRQQAASATSVPARPSRVTGPVHAGARSAP